MLNRIFQNVLGSFRQTLAWFLSENCWKGVSRVFWPGRLNHELPMSRERLRGQEFSLLMKSMCPPELPSEHILFLTFVLSWAVITSNNIYNLRNCLCRVYALAWGGLREVCFLKGSYASLHGVGFPCAAMPMFGNLPDIPMCVWLNITTHPFKTKEFYSKCCQRVSTQAYKV